MPVGEPRASEKLTPREAEIVELLLRGERVSTIAAGLGVSRSTVRAHLASTFSKLDVHSQPELVQRMRERAGRGPPARADGSLDALRQTIEAANGRLLDALERALGQEDPLPAMRRAIHAYLPLSPDSRDEWLARLRYWEAVGRDSDEDASRPLELALRQGRKVAASPAAQRFMSRRVDPDAVVDSLSKWIFGASIQLLSDARPETRTDVLARCDRFLEELAGRSADRDPGLP